MLGLLAGVEADVYLGMREHCGAARGLQMLCRAYPPHKVQV